MNLALRFQVLHDVVVVINNNFVSSMLVGLNVSDKKGGKVRVIHEKFANEFYSNNNGSLLIDYRMCFQQLTQQYFS